jgi:hypothetical protein
VRRGTEEATVPNAYVSLPRPDVPLTRPNEPRPDPIKLTHNFWLNPESDSVDYMPYPSISLPLSAERQKILNAVTRLYSTELGGKRMSKDLDVYTRDAVYDGPYAYADTLPKLAALFHPLLSFFTSRTLSTQVVQTSSLLPC